MGNHTPLHPPEPDPALAAPAPRPSMPAGVTYVLIETRTTWESEEVRAFLGLAGALADTGGSVDVFLAQNGVLMACARTLDPALVQLMHRPNVTVWVDDFSLASRVRGRQPGTGVRLGSAAILVQLITRAGCKPIWH